MVDFHTRHKLVVLSRGQRDYKTLGRLIANDEREPVRSLAARHISHLMKTLKIPATRRNPNNHIRDQVYLNPAPRSSCCEILCRGRRSYPSAASSLFCGG